MVTTDSPAAAPKKKIIVAIHGVGNQQRSATIRSVVRRLGSLSDPPLPIMPLGFFNIGEVGEVSFRELAVEKDHPLKGIGFAEVYWADVPRGVVTQGDTLEESKAWGKTIVGHAQALYNSTVKSEPRQLDDVDFNLTAGVVEEIVEAVAVMQNLLWIVGKAGLFKFDLAPILTDYVGDVQLVAEFQGYRKTIVNRFHDAMTQILKQAGTDDAEIYIVAHSEGTVVSFVAMLQALGAPVDTTVAVEHGRTASYDWIRNVRGFMTFGSPIDKHLLLWSALWPAKGTLKTQLQPDGSVTTASTNGKNRVLPSRIQWRNYYDFGDPIGFQLDTARQYLSDHECTAFDFEMKHDYGFSRYILPGAAHIGYWNDRQVFEHFVSNVVFADRPAYAEKKIRPPKTKLIASVASLAIPYLLCFALHLAAVYAMFKGIITFFKEQGGPITQTTLCVVALATLLASATVCGRLPRLANRRRPGWTVLALVIFIAGAFITVELLPDGAAEFLAGPLSRATAAGSPHPTPSEFICIAAAAIIAMSGWLAPREPKWGRWLMIGLGSIFVVVAIGYAFALRQNEGAQHDALWPLVLAGGMFVYLWWLAILLFDLTFVWHRYIRNSVAPDTLRDWRSGKDAELRTFSMRKPKS